VRYGDFMLRIRFSIKLLGEKLILGKLLKGYNKMNEFPTRDELIKCIALRIRHVTLTKGDSPHEFILGSEKLAEAALKALIDNSPKPVDGYSNKHDMFYRQLMGYRND